MDYYKHYSDEELVALYKNGIKPVENVLINRYSKNIYNKAKGYFMQGLEFEDLYQEALKSFREQESVPFCVFASICINRQLISVIKKAQAFKHKPLNESMSLDADVVRDGETVRLIDMISMPKEHEPENYVINNETVRDFMSTAHNVLSSFEYWVFVEFMQSKSYAEIAFVMQCTNKAVDNALQRIKRKLIVIYSNFANV